MAKKTVTVSLPEETLRRLDEQRGDVPRSRFVTRALEKILEVK